MKKILWLCLCLMSISSLTNKIVHAESYPNGVEGIKCGSAPPPGLYYKMYNAYITSDKLVNEKGDEIPVDFEAKLFVNVNRFLWVSKDIKIFNAHLASNIFFPICVRDIKIGALGIDDNMVGIGDIVVEPIILAWYGKRWDFVAGFAMFLPTGATDDPADPGEDMYTYMVSYGGTYFLDDNKSLSASLVARYEIHTEKQDKNYTPGDDFHFEWGVGKTVARIFDVGIGGYCQWQVTDDSNAHGAHKEKAFGIGPQVSMIYPPWKMMVGLNMSFDFGIEGRPGIGRPETQRTFLTFTKIF
ncbi:MAG: transporter [Desulfobacterales bacterium]|nr:transporter [Desulfobacterales bacterium]